MSNLTDADIALLDVHATEIRCMLLDMLSKAPSGHTAGPLGMVDIFTVLYFRMMRHNPEDPHWEDRDRLILSNGHIVPVRYASMARAGYISYDELYTLRQFGSRLQGHPERTRLPGLETTSGPLGEGLGQASGIALGARMDGKTFRTYCVMSDAEQACGSTWEAVMFASARGLSNLTAIIDRNRVQITGKTEDVMPLEPLREKYESFNWHTILIDGHNSEMICDALEEAQADTGKPSVIIAETIPGKGVPEIEGDYRWHGKVPTREQADTWIRALRAQSE
jgi:transketolase